MEDSFGQTTKKSQIRFSSESESSNHFQIICLIVFYDQQ